MYIYVWYTIMQQIYEKHFLYARTKLLKWNAQILHAMMHI